MHPRSPTARDLGHPEVCGLKAVPKGFWLGCRDGFFDAAGLPGRGGADEGGEEGAGESTLGVGALGVPLHGDDPMIGRGELDGFDNMVLGRDGGDAEVVSRDANGLVVAGIHLLRAERGLPVRRTMVRAGLLVPRTALRALDTFGSRGE